MSTEPRTADSNADGIDDTLGLTPTELQKSGTPAGTPMSLREHIGRQKIEDMKEMNLEELTDLLKQVEKVKHLPGSPEFIRLVEIELSERRSGVGVEEAPTFDHAPAPYTSPEGEGDDPLLAEVGLTEIPQKPKIETQLSTHSTIPHLPVIVGGTIFLIAIGGVMFLQGKDEQALPVPASNTQILVNGQSSVTFQVDYGKAGMYAAYVPEQKITYSAGTSASAKAVSWLVCDDAGKFVKMIPLAMQENIEDQQLKSRRWKSTGASALPPGEYQVTVRAESTEDDIAIQSFIFDPIRGVQSNTPAPECRMPTAGI